MRKRVRIGSTIAVVAATFSIAAGVAGPIYSAVSGGHTVTAAVGPVTAGRIMK